jgi:spore coat protein CotH
VAASTTVSTTAGASEGTSVATVPAVSTTLPPRPTEIEGLFDRRLVHDVSAEWRDGDFAYLLRLYEQAGRKVWMVGDLVIDGTEIDDVGLRLKGTPTVEELRAASGLDPDADLAGTAPYVPLLAQLDRFVRGKEYEGVVEFAVRRRDGSSGLNEAVALDLLTAAGLAAQRPTYVRLAVNDGSPVLRLVTENPDEAWDARTFATPGILYKAKSGGDYTYRGQRAAAYVDVFEEEAGEGLDLRPLVDFLEFVNEADDASFAGELAARLDVESFARYLAFEELVGNYDDIDGPGNNSFLRWDRDTERFTVVAWDHNRAFLGPEGVVVDETSAVANPLVARFLAVGEFAAMVEAQRVALRTELVESGLAATVVEHWAQVLRRDASDLVDTAVIEVEAAQILAYLDGE